MHKKECDEEASEAEAFRSVGREYQLGFRQEVRKIEIKFTYCHCA